ncbi:ferric reductase-like transmembrane domain-containing protein [Marinactinospora rubrisoli]|uniref:Ferric reductase-like transmembrane domain-containing protein n=1 Tax=Marinactinospora rubrisoli TaxID=2715399 RepID=A0ABW2KM25_9ACTN
MTERNSTFTRRAEPAAPPLRVSHVVTAIAVSALPFLPLLGRLDVAGGTLPGLANVAGFLGALLIWWQVLLGVRRVSALLTADRVAVVRLHAWLGASGAFFVLLHPLLEMIAEHHDLWYLVRIDFTWPESSFTSLGRIAVAMFLALWLTSTLLRAAVRYRTWRYTHYLAYPLAALVFVHSSYLGTFLAELPWLWAYWLALAWSFAAVCAWRLAGPLLSPRYRLVRSERLCGTITACTLAPVGRALRPAPGQFCHLRTALLSPSHPLSVVGCTEDGELTFAVRDAGPFTDRLRALEPGDTVFVDGPYGTFTGEARRGDRPTVLVAGGVGITPFVELVRRHPTDVTLFHVTRSPEEAVFGAELRERLGTGYINVVSAPGPDRPGFDVGDMLHRLGPAARRARFFVCGGPGFVERVRTRLRDEGIGADRLFTEEFEF